jgi:hypothetical protein
VDRIKLKPAYFFGTIVTRFSKLKYISVRDTKECLRLIGRVKEST